MSEKQDGIEDLELRVRELEIKLSKTIEALAVVSGNLAKLSEVSAEQSRVVAEFIGLSISKLGVT